jgi:ADP-heptose:LPS heptosyltransferase
MLERLDAEGVADPTCVTVPEILPRNARLLILRSSHLGDVLHVVPLAEEIKRQRADVRVEILVGPWCESLARRYDCFDEVIVYAPDFVQFNRGDRRRVLPRSREVAFLRSLRERRYQVIVSTSPPHLADQIVMRAAIPVVAIGARGGLEDFPVAQTDLRRDFNSRQREADWVCSFLADLGLKVEAAHLSFPCLPNERARAESLLGSLPRPRVVIAPGAGWPGKCWPVERYAVLADLLVEKTRASVVVIGSPDEKELGAGLISRMKQPALNLVGATSLGESAAVIASCDLFIGNDSAPLHLAAAVGTPTLALFGPTFTSKWAPNGPRDRVLQTEIACDGCIYWHCRASCQHDGRCMKAISVADAFGAASAMLSAVANSSELPMIGSSAGTNFQSLERPQ